MRSDFLHMSTQEMDRHKAMALLESTAATQQQIARRLRLSVRQVKRLWRAYRLHGAAGLVSGHRNKPGNHHLNPHLIEQAIALIRERYADFGPTLASEKLAQHHGLYLSKETTRHHMIAAGLWRADVRRRGTHPPRQRRERFGELVQIDGSPHPWFEDREPRCTLLVFIDDATSAILGARFVHAETTQAYFELCKLYFKQYGLPEALYSDKCGVFRINTKDARVGELTAFGEAMEALHIELICAHSPQAKGRVERANRTLQDRLTKELRLAGISDMDAANQFLDTYLPTFNDRFARSPYDDHNAHRVLDDHCDLDRTLTIRETRTLTKDLLVQYKARIYRIIPTTTPRLVYPKARIDILEMPDGSLRMERQGVALQFTLLDAQKKLPPIRTPKELYVLPSARGYSHPQKAHQPPATHPWRTYAQPAT